MPKSPTTNSKRVLILNYEFPPLGGGAANATYYLLKEYGLRPDVNVTLITSSIDQEKIEAFASNVTLHYLDIGKQGNIHYQSQGDLLKYSWKAYWRAKQLIRRDGFDVIHAFFGIPCGYIAMKLGLPYIVSLRGSDVPFYNSRFYWQDKILFKRLSRRVWKKAEHVVANSAGLAELALKSAKGQSIQVIPNGIDASSYSKSDLPNNSNTIRLISTGRLIPRKGYDILIKAMSGLSGLTLQIIGDGPEKDNLIKLASSKGVEVVFCGSVEHDQIPDLLSKADLFVLPSLNEGMSNAALEALAARLPVILTDVGGSTELISNNGWIVKPNSISDLREVLEDVLRNPEQLRDMSSASRAMAESMSWKSAADAYFNLY